MEINILPKFIDEAATPIAQSVGNSISGIWDLVFGNHVSLWIKKQEVRHQRNYEDFVNRTNAKIERISEDNLREPEMYILGPAIEASKYYIASEELREMFANLIASSVDSRADGIVHPSFVEIIKQLSSLDASILKNFTAISKFPIVRINLTKENSAYQLIYENILDYTESDKFESYISSISNIQRLGLIDINYTISLAEPTNYEFVEKHPAYLKAKGLLQEKEYQSYQTCDFDEGVTKLTPLGKNFVLACCIN
ncbi:DUF4393 domain-containing protein [Viridibacillus arvi]|uniref:DUF4393 domain-containing protein n=1 Tax=Viridibacillus arvi TaxID=263475 RepID=UPI003D079F71